MTRSKAAVPIDRGWAWVVVAAAFMNLFLLIGISKCFGILFAELIELYHGTASETSTMLALSAGLSLFIAPLVTMLSDRYTCRIVSMIGGVICCLGFLVPAYCSSLEQVILSFSILTGLGYGVCLTPSAIIVGRYFERRRSLANGLMFSGSGVGGVVVPLLLNYFIHLFGLHGALLILAGLAFQTILFSALYLPLEYWTGVERPAEVAQENEEVQALFKEDKREAPTDKLSPLGDPSRPSTNRRRLSSSGLLCVPDNCGLRPHASASRLADEAVQNLSSGKLNHRGPAESQLGSKMTVYFSAMNLIPRLSVPEVQHSAISYCDHGVQTDSDVDQVRDQASSHPNVFQRCCGRISRRMCYVKADDGSDLPLFDLSLLRDARFVLFIIGSMFVLASVCLGMIIPPHCVELGMTRTEVALLLSVQGGADTAGRLLAGFTGDRAFVKSRRKTLTVVYCLIGTVSTLASVFLTTFWSLAMYLVVCSLAVGAFVASTPVVLVDLVGVENLSRAWGLTVFVEGFSVTLSPLIIGALRDWTSSYTSGLIFIDSCFALAAFCILTVVLLDSKRSGSSYVPTAADTQK